MADVQNRITNFLQNPFTRQVAKGAPFLLVSGLAGVTLGSLLASPGGVAIVLGGLAINVTSDIIKQLTDPTRDDFIADDDQRSDVLRQELERGNTDVQALTAGLLVHEGATVADALPDASQSEIVSALDTGMKQAGGPLAAIAPRYVEALRDPATDWEHLRAELKTTVSTSTQSRKATNIRRGQQLSEGYDHSSQTAEATEDIEDFNQVAKRNPGGTQPG
jgi:hypothetical protein